MRFGRHKSAWLLLALLLAVSGCAALQDNVGGMLKGGSGGAGTGTLDESTVAAGLKEALRVGTQNTVLSTSKVDGFLGNALIRIAIPSQMKPMASALRQAGFGVQVDELEVGMNRAAELAAGQAREVFWNAITNMTISDAFGILRGGNRAATDFFHERTYDTLRARFHPIVEQKIQEVGLSRLYGRISDTYNSLPLAGAPRMVDLDEYVTDQSLAGLFTVLASEEQKIRQDPKARTTELLRRVFGS